MQKIGNVIPTIIQNIEQNNSLKCVKKKALNIPPGVVIFQHNNLIEARYSLTLQEKRLILWLTSRIHPDDQDFKKHTIGVNEFTKILGLSGHANYSELQKITLGLMKKVLVIKRPDEKRLIQVAWLCCAEYEEGIGLIHLSFAPEMHPFLLNLKNRFTVLQMSDLMQFKSIHAIRIYELLKQYQSIGERILTIDEIKACCGVVSKLKKYDHFEKRLLLAAQKEINAKSDIKFEFERKKSSRKITGIKFIITQNKAYELINNPKKFDNKNIKEVTPSYIEHTLSDFGLLKSTIKKIIKNNTEETIANAIKAVDRQIEKGQVRNAKAMLITAIKEKWHSDMYKS